MAKKKNIIIGFILMTLLLGSGVVYLQLNEDVRMRVDHDKTTFYVPHEDYSWIWTVSGREENRLFDGSSIMNRDTSEIYVETAFRNSSGLFIYREGELVNNSEFYSEYASLEENQSIVKRHTSYLRGPLIIDTYFYDGNIEDVESFPISHQVKVINGSEYFYRYTVNDLHGTGEKRKIYEETSLYFGKNMKVEFQEENKRWSWIGWPYGSNSFSIQYDIPSDNETYNLRLVDPKTSLGRGDYSDRDLKVDFEDLLGNKEVLNMTLKSHNSVDEVKSVATGKQVVMWYDSSSRNHLINALGEPTFKDMRTGKEVQRDYRYVYWTNETYQEPIIECDYVVDLNSTNGTKKLECVENGFQNKTREVWKEYNSRDLPKGQIRIGIEVEVRNNDYIDGIWEVGGKKINKHAVWESSLETGLISWYKLDETSGTNASDSHNGNHGTSSGVTVNETGKIENSYLYDGDTDEVDFGTSAFSFEPGDNFSISMWIKPNVPIDTTDRMLFSKQDGSSPFQGYSFSVRTRTDTKRFQLESSGSSGNYFGAWDYDLNAQNGNWLHVVLVYDGVDDPILYVNNSVVTQTTDNNAWAGSVTAGINAYLGNRDGINQGFRGNIDEVGIWNRSLSASEVTNLYNEGNGCTYQLCDEEAGLTINLVSPSNNTNFSTNNINLVGNVTDTASISIDNVSLLINGQINETNTSGVSGIYNFSKNINDGEYNWTIQAYGNDSIQYNASNGTLFFNVDTINPSIFYNSNTDEDNSFSSKNWIFVNVTASDTSLDSVIFNWDGTNETFDNSDGDIYWENQTSLAEGEYTFYACAEDTFSNSNCTSTRTVTLDTTAPTFTTIPSNDTITYPNDWTGVDFDATDETSFDSYSVNDSRFTINSTGYLDEVSTLGAGSYEILITINDSAGNENSTEYLLTVNKASGAVELWLDGARASETVEVNTAVNIEGNLTTGTFGTLNLTIDDAEVNSSSSENLTYTFQDTGIGTYVVNLSYTGNENYTSDSESWNITYEDTSAPSVTVLFPEAGQTYESDTLDLNYSATDNLGDSCWYTKDNGAINSSAVAFGTNFTDVVTSQGENTWKVYCNDTSGNIGSDAHTFTVNNAPDVTINSPLNQTYTTSTITFNITATDDSGVDSAWFSLGGANITLSNILYAEGDYTGDSHNIGTYPRGVDVYDNEIWRVKAQTSPTNDKRVYHTELNGSVIESFDVSSVSGDPFGIIVNETNFWITDSIDEAIYKFHKNGTYIENYTIGAGAFYGIEKNSTHFFIITSTGVLRIYDSTFQDTGDNFDLTACGNSDARAITYNGTYFWITDTTDDSVYKYESDGTCLGESFSTVNNPWGLGNNGTYFWLNDVSNQEMDKLYLTEVLGDDYYYTNSSMTGGQHTARFYANDSFGNLNDSEQVTFSIDTSPPSINILHPENGTVYPSEQTELNFSISDLNLDSCWYSTDDGTTNNSVSCSSNVSGLSSAEGSNTWNVYANDTFGNEASNLTTFFIDTTDPVVNFVSPTEDNNTNVSRDWIFINVSVTETNFKNITFYLYNLDGTVNTSQSYTDSTREHNFTSLNGGFYLYNVSVFDEVNNSGSSGTRKINLDLFGPEVHLISPANNTEFNMVDVNFSANATDTSGLKNMTLSIWDGNTLISDEFDFTGETGSSDPVNGNVGGLLYWNDSFWVLDYGDERVYEYTTDWTYTGNFFSTASETSPYGWGITHIADRFVIGDRDGDIFFYYNNGTYTGESMDGDALAGNGLLGGMDSFDDYIITTDYQDKKIYFYYESNRTYSGESINLVSGNQNPSGLAYNDGYFYVADEDDKNVRKYDRQSNLLATYSTSVNSGILQTATLGLTIKENFWIGRDVSSGFEEYYLFNREATGESETVNWTYSFSSSGNYTWNVQSCDIFGQCSFSEEGNYTVIIDLLPPTVTINSPDNNTYQDNSSFITNGTVYDNDGIQNVSLILDSVYNETNSSGINNSDYIFTKTLSEGNHTWKYEACDTFEIPQCTESDLRTIVIDLTNPSIFYNPNTDDNNSFVNRSWILINITASDTNLNDVRMEYEGTNETFDNQDGNIYWENKSGLSDGNYSFYAWADDLVGRFNSTPTREVIVDTTNPEISFISPTKVNDSNETVDWIFVNVSVNETYEEVIKFELYNSTGLVFSNLSSSQQREINWTNLSDGTYHYNVTVNDSASNSNSTETRKLTIDTTNPSIQFVSPTTATGTTENDYIQANVTASDTHLDTINLTLYNSTGLVQSNISTTSPLFVNYTGLSSGTYFLNATVNDTFGLTNSTETREIEILILKDFNITLNTNITFEFTPDNNSHFGVEPLGQNSTHGTFLANNNLSNTIDIYAKLNETYPYGGNLTYKIGNSSNYSESVIIGTDYVEVYSELSVGSDANLWSWADYNDTLQQWFPELEIKANEV